MPKRKGGARPPLSYRRFATARIIGEWLRMECRLQGETHGSQMAGSQNLRTRVPDERQPSCFALEEERGVNWKGTRAAPLAIKEANWACVKNRKIVALRYGLLIA